MFSLGMISHGAPVHSLSLPCSPKPSITVATLHHPICHCGFICSVFF